MFLHLSLLAELLFLMKYSEAFSGLSYPVGNAATVQHKSNHLHDRSLLRLGASSPPSFPFGDPFSPRRKTDYNSSRSTSQQGKSSEVLIEAPSLNSRKISANIVVDASIDDLW